MFVLFLFLCCSCHLFKLLFLLKVQLFNLEVFKSFQCKKDFCNSNPTNPTIERSVPTVKLLLLCGLTSNHSNFNLYLVIYFCFFFFILCIFIFWFFCIRKGWWDRRRKIFESQFVFLFLKIRKPNNSNQLYLIISQNLIPLKVTQFIISEILIKLN